MVNVILPDCIIHDILARLPTKVLYRCKCVSKHWNSLITDPYFIKMRKRQMILLPSSPIQVLDDNYPNDDMANLMFKLPSPYRNPQNNDVIFLGTVNGIVLLVVNYTRMILYNPFTGASKLLPYPISDLACGSNHIYGFGYGATLDDLKILRFDQSAFYAHQSAFYARDYDILHVFRFRTNSWSMSRNYNIKNILIKDNDVGTFLNVSLHWIVYKYQMMIMALNLENMVLSYIPLPVPGSGHNTRSRLATLHGRLCIIDSNYYGQTRLFVSVMKEQGVWSEQCLFISGLEVINIQGFAPPLTLLNDGRILMMNNSKKLIIYDTLKHSFKVLELSEKLYYDEKHSCGLSVIEYVETLVSPSDFFAV
ncbi:F-box domain-containing protein [Artemisia annua]|uniref:F-box domain-containing protein n=1 Tax=Artemisia annua TaxID=35608 RepID=A0A2U1P387_ARTAN|nr:F-box domain-containing protein [Artemisia annua]